MAVLNRASPGVWFAGDVTVAELRRTRKTPATIPWGVHEMVAGGVGFFGAGTCTGCLVAVGYFFGLNQEVMVVGWVMAVPTQAA